MRQTLVTDFFGGVAQAEVLPSLPEVTQRSRDAADTPYTASTEDTVPAAHTITPISAYRTNDTYAYQATPTKGVDFAAIFAGDATPGKSMALTTFRAWASVVLTGGLVAWASRTHVR